MDFGYTPEQEDLRQQVLDFIGENVSQGLLDEMEGGEDGGRGPEYRELVKKVADKGWIGISWPKEYGGQSGSRIDQYIVEEEFMRSGINVGGAGSGAPAILAAFHLSKETLTDVVVDEITNLLTKVFLFRCVTKIHSLTLQNLGGKRALQPCKSP